MRGTFFCPRWRRRIFLLLAVLLVSSARAVASGDGNAPLVRDCQRDGAGRVWGIGWSSYGGLFALDEQEHWQPVELPGIDGESIWSASMARRADGTVVCLWKLGQQHYRYSEHLGGTSTLHEAFVLPYAHGVDQRRRLFCDSKGGVWLTESGPNIFRFKPDGTPERIHRIPDAECLSEKETGGQIAYWSPIETVPANTPPAAPATELAWEEVAAFEDADGHLWFWTDHAGYSGYLGMTIRGAVVYDGENFVQHDFLAPGGKGNKPLTALVPKDASHLWAAWESDGLYTLDTSTFQAGHVAGQPPEAESTTFAASGKGGNWFFVMGESEARNGSTLWKLGADNHWSRLVDGVEPDVPRDNQLDRPWIETGHGGYLGSIGAGLWFLPEDGSGPRHLDWRENVALATPQRLVELPNDRLLGVGMNGLMWVGTPETIRAGSVAKDHPGIRLLHTASTLVVDEHRHFWSTFNDQSRSLREWDGEQWIDHPFPPGAGANVDGSLRVLHFDGRGRLWLRSESPGQRTAIYDPSAEDHWQVFTSFTDALVAQEGRHEAEMVLAEGNGGTWDLPRFGPDGWICYRSNEEQFFVFDGHAWRSWSAKEITGNEDAALGYAPYFGQLGRVSITISEYTTPGLVAITGRSPEDAAKTWRYVDGAGWQRVPWQQGFAEEYLQTHQKPFSPPAEAKIPFQPEQSVRDNEGTWWMRWQEQIYKARENLCVPVFKPGEVHPFITGLALHSALVDARGNTFLFSAWDDDHASAVILAAGSRPHTSLTPEGFAAGEPLVTAADEVKIRVSTDAAPIDGKVRFDWRLDGGAWTTLTVNDPVATVRLEGLSSGVHRFEARSFDPDLQTDLTPAMVTFEIRLDSRAQLAGYIAQLAEPEESQRKAAVLALARQPEPALPALQAARARVADENQRWWIDAALQALDSARQDAARQARESRGDNAR